MPTRTRYDAVIVGSGHNGLVAAAYLANAGQSVLVLERNDWIGGATASQRVFPDYDAYLSRYAYLVSLLPRRDPRRAGDRVRDAARRPASFTAYEREGVARGLVISNVDEARSKASMHELTGGDGAWDGYQALLQARGGVRRAGVAQPAAADSLARLLGRPVHRECGSTRGVGSFVERPLGEAIERHVQDDVLRGLLFTDGKIGVFAMRTTPR